MFRTVCRETCSPQLELHITWIPTSYTRLYGAASPEIEVARSSTGATSEPKEAMVTDVNMRIVDLEGNHGRRTMATGKKRGGSEQGTRMSPSK
uniref:Uncharacterized protein n=1 Tax=Steinernema glaseri TaxID=37863 RepID=A0A1I8AKJ9_9BILA